MKILSVFGTRPEAVKSHPFPEEINRRIATVIADLHFAPTEGSREICGEKASMDKTSW